MRCRALQIPTVLQMPSVFPYTADTHCNAQHSTADSSPLQIPTVMHCTALQIPNTADAHRPTLQIASPSWGPAEESHKLGYFPEKARDKIHWTEPKLLVGTALNCTTLHSNKIYSLILTWIIFGRHIS